MASSLITFSGLHLHVKPSLRSCQALPLNNPISNLHISSWSRKDKYFGSWSNKSGLLRMKKDMAAKRNVFVVVYAANTIPAGGAPLPSGPPPSSNSMSWILGLIVSLIIPMFTHKMGPLGLLKNRFDNVIQTVEDIAETVEKVAGEVDKIAENIAHDLPQGKLKNLVELVEHVAEDTAKNADCLDNIIDQVQEAEEQVVDIVASVVEEAKKSPKEIKNQ